MNVEFLYEDLYILAVNKPSNLIVHPTLNPLRPHLIQFLKEKHEDLHLLHRLDADTTGVLILAKGSENTKRFSLLFSNRNVEKVYHAIVEGRPPFNETTIRNHLAPMIGMKSQFTSVHSGGKVAETRFKILSKGKKFSFVEAIPLTGRTHQIRVHLAELGFPIVGDQKYGAPLRHFAQRPLLHASSLLFLHPITKEETKVIAPLPNDFLEILQALQLNKC